MFDEEITMKILNNEVDLDQECGDCDGGKKEPTMPKNKDGSCRNCGGKKYVLTSAGEAIVNLIVRHLQVRHGKKE